MLKICLVILTACAFSSFSVDESICLSAEERQLYELLMDYRKQKNLPPIPLSYSLTKVARLHVQDLVNNNPTSAKCNLHSWSSNGIWSSCCYTDNHKEAECMWNKPRELSTYSGDGFEIAAFLGESATAKAAIAGWKKSTGHNQVMINQGSWKKMNWQAVGVGIEKGYAVIWFGTDKDPDSSELVGCE